MKKTITSFFILMAACFAPVLAMEAFPACPGPMVIVDFWDKYDKECGRVEMVISQEDVGCGNPVHISVPNGAQSVRLRVGKRLEMTLPISENSRLRQGHEISNEGILGAHKVFLSLKANRLALKVFEGDWSTIGRYDSVTIMFSGPHSETVTARQDLDDSRPIFFKIPKGFDSGHIWVEEHLAGGFRIEGNDLVGLSRAIDYHRGDANTLYRVLGRDVVAFYAGNMGVAVRIYSRLPKKPDPDDWGLVDSASFHRLMVEYYSAGGGLSNSELWETSRFIIRNSKDYELQGWACCMRIERSARRFEGSEQLARWGLLVLKPHLSLNTLDAMNNRLLPYDGIWYAGECH